MGEHKITIEIISNPENNVLRPQSYTLQKYGQYSHIYTHYEQVYN